MKITGKIIIRDENAPELAEKIAQSLEPDNLKDITTEHGDDSVTVHFKSDKIGSLIATVDDYLMNAKIASDMLSALENNEEDDD